MVIREKDRLNPGVADQLKSTKKAMYEKLTIDKIEECVHRAYETSEAKKNFKDGRV